MKKSFFFLAFLIVFFSVGFFVLRQNSFFNSPQVAHIISPLPSYLSNSQLVRSLDFWKPAQSVLSDKIEKPEISAKAAFVYDIASDKVLFEKNSRQRLPIASLAKIATAIVAFESIDPKNKITISQKAASIGEDSMGLSAGETYTLEELLYGLVLHSGNDAAEAIAEGVSGNSQSFVAKMNQKAKILGLHDTVFVNPTGLEEDPPAGEASPPSAQDSSTAYDLAILTKYALGLPVFAKVVATVEYDIPYASDHKHLYLFNETNLLTSYPGVKGVKTGYTPSAGLCLITYAENGGHKLIGVILNSPSRREEMRALLDYSFATLGVKVP